MNWSDDRLDAKFEHIDRRFDEVDGRFDKIDARFDRLEDRFDRLQIALIVTLGSLLAAAIASLAAAQF